MTELFPPVMLPGLTVKGNEENRVNMAIWGIFTGNA